ncbi:type II secretion system protein GspL [Legionella oakridgensis]|uniref:type II secretion system protein GspL n=1 Tax=Legionella oakridgensis TaxID=29423 RepID=UPI0003DE3B1F|nr:type II secretion system protein GspL [Legionella oakridgensis]ETO93772.1 type II secretory pathway, component PulL [Legionella oakridgensis RV-2-2007]
MGTCFIFAKQISHEQLLSLRLDDKNEVDAPLLLRSANELHLLQANHRTVVVLPTEVCSLHQLELPWLNERKARAAIPFALEEQLAQNVATLHFAFDRAHYQNHRYLVAVIDKQYLANLIHELGVLNLAFDMITLEWFALQAQEACVSQTSFLAYNETFQGALSLDLAKIYLAERSTELTFYVFQDSAADLSDLFFPSRIDSSFYGWVAQRLQHTKPINLCQGEFQQSKSQQSIRFWYFLSAALAGIWLISLLVVNAIHLYWLNKKNAELDQQIAVLYREFFPEAKQIISPRFRIGQLLKSDMNHTDSALWLLMDKLAHAFSSGQFVIEQLRFQNQVLSVTLLSKDFAALEHLQRRLQQTKVKVSQTQASSHEQQVLATLELRL